MNTTTQTTKRIPSPRNREDWNYGYVLLERKQRGAPWQFIDQWHATGDCCEATAEDYILSQGVNIDWPLRRLVDQETWRQIQVKTHLRDVQGKRR